MAEVLYPDGLPVPQTSDITPAERRALSNADAPREARALERDRRRFERVTFTFTAAQAATFDAWWRTTLIYGGAWFAATWPTMAGQVQAVRKFLQAPRFVFVAGGFFRASVICEVRGASLVPDISEAPAGRSIGWIDPITGNPAGFYTVAHSNAGVANWYFDFDADRRASAAVVDYDAETVVWSAEWTPVNADASPSVDSALGGWITFAINPIFDLDIFQYRPPEGVLRVTSTVDGAPSDAIEISFGFGAYADVAWGPA